MRHFKYLILGAGPAGLSFANRILQKKETDFMVLEKEDEAGGLCRSIEIDESPLDIGGGHFLDVRRPTVCKFLFNFMPKSEWDEYERNSQIVVNNNIINSPIEANIWQMNIDDQVEYLKAIASAGCNIGVPMPEKFTEWIFWKLGKRIAEDYMIPYNKKMFGDDLDRLGTYWLDKLPNVSFEETLRSCLEKQAYGRQPGHARFFYPKKYGYGEVWCRMADKLGEHITYNVDVCKLDFEKRTVNDMYSADYIINTCPWDSIETLCGITRDIEDEIRKLRHSSVIIEYHPEMLKTEAQWIYYPNPELTYHRILVRHNFCPNSKGYWTETNKVRYKNNQNAYSYMNEYAYPLNTIGKQESIKKILTAAERSNVFGLGRWGEWQHYNSDLVVEKGILLADKLEKADL